MMGPTCQVHFVCLLHELSFLFSSQWTQVWHICSCWPEQPNLLRIPKLAPLCQIISPQQILYIHYSLKSSHQWHHVMRIIGRIFRGPCWIKKQPNQFLILNCTTACRWSGPYMHKSQKPKQEQDTNIEILDKLRRPWIWYYTQSEEIWNIQGDPKKMSHKDSWLKSVLEVRFYFSAGVLEPENRPHFIWLLQYHPFRIWNTLKTP